MTQGAVLQRECSQWKGYLISKGTWPSSNTGVYLFQTKRLSILFVDRGLMLLLHKFTWKERKKESLMQKSLTMGCVPNSSKTGPDAAHGTAVLV